MRVADPGGAGRSLVSPPARRRGRGLLEPGPGLGLPGRSSGRIWVGWREWVALPGLGIPALKAKIDTGARTSALHVFDLSVFRGGHGRERVRFSVLPLQGRRDVRIACEADVVDRRMITDSGGHRERRIVIFTPLSVGGATWDIELTLASRDTLRFRMLLGRTALAGHALVNPAASYRQGRDLGAVYPRRKKRRKKSRPRPRSRPDPAPKSLDPPSGTG